MVRNLGLLNFMNLILSTLSAACPNATENADWNNFIKGYKASFAGLTDMLRSLLTTFDAIKKLLGALTGGAQSLPADILDLLIPGYSNISSLLNLTIPIFPNFTIPPGFSNITLPNVTMPNMTLPNGFPNITLPPGFPNITNLDDLLNAFG